MTNSGFRAAQGCPLQPSKKATRNFSCEKKLMVPNTLPHRSCIKSGKESASNRKGYSIPFWKKQERSRSGISSAGHPDTLTIWGCVDNTDRRRESANKKPAAGSEAVRQRSKQTTLRDWPFQKRIETNL